MAKKKKQEEGAPGSPAWMATFSDLMNLLLCFFVLLFSMSSVDESKAEALIKSLADTFSIFEAGGSSFEEGALIANGAEQLSFLDDYFNDGGQTANYEWNENTSVSEDAGGESNKAPEEAPGINPQVSPTPIPIGGDRENEGREEKNNLGERSNGESDKDNEKGEKLNGNSVNVVGNDGQNEDNIGDKDQEGAIDVEKAEGLIREKQRVITENLYTALVESAALDSIGDTLEISVDSSNFNYVRINIQGAVLFDTGSVVIKESAKPVLSKFGDMLKAYEGYKIEIIGHTDNVPITGGKYEDNDILSCARAISVTQYLTGVKKINPKLITYAGRGETEPIASNETEEGRAKNRRVEIRIYNLHGVY